MPKNNVLHALLAVETDKKNLASKIMKETSNTFNKKDSHFEGFKKVYESTVENGDNFPPDSKEIVTTVQNKLNYAIKKIADGINAQVSKEETNASGSASAELVIGDKSFGVLSATSLLALENQLKMIRSMYNDIPTLDPTKKWSIDEQTGLYVTETELRYRTVKTPIVITKAEATEFHPAQTEIYNVDKQVGQWKTEYKSGKITPLQKSNLLDRIESLIAGVKIARAKANNAIVVNSKVANDIFKFINKDII